MNTLTLPVSPAGAADSHTVRPARPADIPGLYALIRHYSDQEILLPRTKRDLRNNIHDFRVIASTDRVLACAVLHLYTPKIAELRSLAVVPDLRGAGLGRLMVEALLQEARRGDLEMVFAFTYATDFFARLGFAPIDRSLVPWKAWKDCANCPKQECCDEVAVAYWLRSPAATTSRPAFPILSNYNI